MTFCLNRPDEDTFYIYHCRNWGDCQKFLDDVSDQYGVGPKHWSKDEKKYIPYGKWHKARRVLLCYIHNASYEFAFCRQELKFARGEYDFFSKNSRKMIIIGAAIQFIKADSGNKGRSRKTALKKNDRGFIIQKPGQPDLHITGQNRAVQFRNQKRMVRIINQIIQSGSRRYLYRGAFQIGSDSRKKGISRGHTRKHTDSVP